MSFQSKAKAQAQMVTTGQTQSANSTGLGPVSNFDVAAEKADWNKVTSQAQPGTSGQTGSGNIPVVVPIIGCLQLLQR